MFQKTKLEKNQTNSISKTRNIKNLQKVNNITPNTQTNKNKLVVPKPLKQNKCVFPTKLSSIFSKYERNESLSDSIDLEWKEIPRSNYTNSNQEQLAFSPPKRTKCPVVLDRNFVCYEKKTIGAGLGSLSCSPTTHRTTPNTTFCMFKN
ncbi:hypothetical protein M0812_19737 [Anaeramoeba flamelloides]|uniref:Uncharacterized protein n=1 Tax=Anaeramoeba flamelloides TaxID=1746091 RepID=A0AAV7Z0G7_9EUKA|nr:hypothetical protein M0812_19737 [Anaeramoeba flamelloides]